jgi:flagellar assembly protein FliH
MSSRLLRDGDSKFEAATTWRPVQSDEAMTAWSEESAGPGNPAVKAEIESRIAAAYQQGLDEAEAAANQRAMHKLEPVIAGLSHVVQQLAGARKHFRAEAEQDTVKLAIAIARRVLHRELSTDPEAILGLVMVAFQKLNARETYRLRVSPSDAAAIQEHRSRMDLPPGLEISTDAALAPGSAIFETSRGELDACVGTQLAEIDRGFADLARRRAQ